MKKIFSFLIFFISIHAQQDIHLDIEEFPPRYTLKSALKQAIAFPGVMLQANVDKGGIYEKSYHQMTISRPDAYNYKIDFSKETHTFSLHRFQTDNNKDDQPIRFSEYIQSLITALNPSIIGEQRLIFHKNKEEAVSVSFFMSENNIEVFTKYPSLSHKNILSSTKESIVHTAPSIVFQETLYSAKKGCFLSTYQQDDSTLHPVGMFLMGEPSLYYCIDIQGHMSPDRWCINAYNVKELKIYFANI